ncbi:hypothetical protein AB0I84_10490 [Streptomyces spectabilis]|uniref:hypothetical protein n=1 Tax=Streptomyces spectabilis TaxID=68270 RepID=UPI0033ED90E8
MSGEGDAAESLKEFLMHAPLPDPLAVLQVATDRGITEEQAATAIEWAAHLAVHAWGAYAELVGVENKDGSAMEAWFHSLPADTRAAVLDDAVTAVLGADNALADIYQQQDRRGRVMRTNRRRVHIR